MKSALIISIFEALDLIAEDAAFLAVAYPDYAFATHRDIIGIQEYAVGNYYEFTRLAHKLGIQRRH